ncbi:hypothetical protein [Agromyces bauzanensis]
MNTNTAAAPSRFTCPDSHKHAESTSCYKAHGCRCDSCTTHNTAKAAERERAKLYGRFDDGLVEAGPVREHMAALAEFGLGYKRIAGLAGASVTTVRILIHGRQDGTRRGEIPKRVSRETARRILRVKPEVGLLADGALITARGAHRRIQALVTRGWSQAKLAARLGMTRPNFGAMMQREQVTAATHRAIAALFEQLWDVEPPRRSHEDRIAYARTIKYAAVRRWLPPMAWDDIDTDPEPPVIDEGDFIDEIAIDLALSGEHVRLSSAERRTAVSRAHAMKWSDNLTARTIGCVPETVARIRRELDLEAWPFEELEQVA